MIVMAKSKVRRNGSLGGTISVTRGTLGSICEFGWSPGSSVGSFREFA